MNNVLEQKIHYTFQNKQCLEQALTHPSVNHEKREIQFHNQRLEFLGDAVLQMLCTEFLFQSLSDADEGEMTRMRSNLVNRQAMCDLARQLNLGEYLIMGRGEDTAGGRNRSSNLADAIEAVIGAIYLDGGWPAAKTFLTHVLQPFWQQHHDNQSITNPKGLLQEIVQERSSETLVYSLVQCEGPDHARIYTVKLTWRGREIGRGTGSSKKQAEVSAAMVALNDRSWLESDNNFKDMLQTD